jgi:16S rRNA G1207 methylase RsmC
LALEDIRSAAKAGASVVRFDELLAGAEIERAEEIEIAPPKWRGYGFIDLCEWLACAKLVASPQTRVTFVAPVRGGATGVRNTLTRRGWAFREGGRGWLRTFEGRPPAPGEQPAPRMFTASVGGTELAFEADWGVFSPNHIDGGSQALIDRAMEIGKTPSVVDVGVGYGAVSTALLASGTCESAIGSDVDLVALHLAKRNAAAAGVHLDLVAEDDPTNLPASSLTVCEIPTHISDPETQLLVSGLRPRARHGLVLVAVHNGLVARYRRLLGDARVVEGETHAVLELGARSRS